MRRDCRPLPDTRAPGGHSGAVRERPEGVLPIRAADWTSELLEYFAPVFPIWRLPPDVTAACFPTADRLLLLRVLPNASTVYSWMTHQLSCFRIVRRSSF